MGSGLRREGVACDFVRMIVGNGRREVCEGDGGGGRKYRLLGWRVLSSLWMRGGGQRGRGVAFLEGVMKAWVLLFIQAELLVIVADACSTDLGQKRRML